MAEKERRDRWTKFHQLFRGTGQPLNPRGPVTGRCVQDENKKKMSTYIQTANATKSNITTAATDLTRMAERPVQREQGWWKANGVNSTTQVEQGLIPIDTLRHKRFQQRLSHAGAKGKNGHTSTFPRIPA